MGGRVVRLRQGNFEQMDVYGDDPVRVARQFSAAGARWLHIVDLDGARSGRPRHVADIARMLDAVGADVACEVSGGLRTEASVQSVLESRARRAVLGTRALQDPSMVRRLVSRHGPDRIAVAIDVRDGIAVGEAWQAGVAGRPVAETIQKLIDAGVVTFEVTAIDRDGGLGGPDLELLASAVALGASVIASAGIRSVADISAVRAVGCAGVIVGRALYDGSLDLAEAIAATA
ncbi:MAG: 1-(5-phosphoribosyl)-5-[(5-phosphoribosylamino)methylideneamino] imidazole-4-carboxamide isomerase [Candidatus Limnocylindrales bacterium]